MRSGPGERDPPALPGSFADYNAAQIEASEQANREGVQWLARGLVAVGGAAAVAGLVMGYGVARGLHRTIHRLQVHVQDAAGKLGQEWPAIVFTEEGDLDRLHDQVEALVGQVEDVVGRLRQREQEVLRADQLAAVGQVAASVAHEIRNPLTSIKMLVQGALEERGGAGPGRTAHPGPEGPPGTSRASALLEPLEPTDLQVIEQEIRRMERRCKTFLDFARPPRPERTCVDLSHRRRTDAGPVARAGRTGSSGPATPQARGAGQVEADGEQLQQVLVNLTLNALDASRAAGE